MYERATKLLEPAVKVPQDCVQTAQELCECLQECGIPVPIRILESRDVVTIFTSCNTKFLCFLKPIWGIIFVEFLFLQIACKTAFKTDMKINYPNIY